MCQILIGSIELPPIVLLSLIVLFIFQVYLCDTKNDLVYLLS